MNATVTASQPQTNPADRMPVVDALRGFALLGIIVNHSVVGFLAGPPPGIVPFNVFSPLDGIFSAGAHWLTFGKFFTIFSFLFGLSFAIQLERARQKESAFAGRFLGRLVILFAIGFVHGLFFSGDILVTYAILGLLLLPARFLSHKVLLPLALVLILNVPNLVKDIYALHAPAPTPAAAEAGKRGFEAFQQMARQQFRTKQTGTLAEVVRMNATGRTSGLGFLSFQLKTGRLWVATGLFLLGLYAGRRRIFSHTPEGVQFFKRLLIGSGLAALLATTLAARYGSPMGGATSWLDVLGNFAYSVQQASLSAFYVAGIVVLYWQTGARRILNYLAPVGQMSLTTYLTQSVLGLCIFFGFGLGMLGHLGAAASISIGIAIFALQMLFANYWMARYQYGPVEWLWRSLTYLKLQPLRKQSQIPVAAA